MKQLLHVDLSTRSNAVVVTVAGELDMTTAGLLAEHVEEAQRLLGTARAVVVDLTGVGFIAAAGVAVLLHAHRTCEALGVPLWVVAPAEFARRTLRICDLDSVLHVVAKSPAVTAERLRSALEGRASADHTAAVLTTGANAPGLRIDVVAAAWETEPADFRAHIADLSAALSRQGHRVVLLIRRTSGDLPDAERTRMGYDLVRVAAGPPTTLNRAALLPHLDEFAARLDRRWAEHAPDVVHLHSWTSGLAVRACEATLVQSFHGLKTVQDADSASTSKVRDLELLTALSAHHVITTSSHEVAGLVRAGVPRARMTLVPWGVDTDLFSPHGPAAPRGAVHRVVALGEVAPRSGFRAAIEALTAAPGAELLVVGPIRSALPREDPEVTSLIRHARAHGVDDRVRFTGQVSRRTLAALLRSADVALRVPWRDPGGGSALQAMACGVPLIASRVDALPDIVVEDVTGLLVPPGDAPALGQALRGLLDDPMGRDVHAITSVDRARTRYSWDRVTTEAVATYRKARTPAAPTNRHASR